jgi:DNA-binding Lrp family transcriptional regulator
MRLDEIDKAILTTLTNDGRISNRMLAQRVKISESACRERVRRLEREGVILGYRAVLTPTFGSDRFEVLASISLAEASMSVVARLDDALHQSGEVVSSYTLTGAFDYVIRYVAANAVCWEAFCRELEAIGVGRDRIKFGIVTSRRESAG